MGLKQFKRVLNEVTHIESFSLWVVNLVSEVCVAVFKQVHNGKNLSVVRHKGFTNSVTAGNESLQNLERNSNDLRVAGVKGG